MTPPNPVTNPLTQLGYLELPFGAISQAQILTGGFGAEFGRSVGGVIEDRWQVTKDLLLTFGVRNDP